MKSIIIGGGKIGYNLIKTLKERKFDVVLVEKREDVCRRIAEETGAEVICGDGTEIGVLEDAGINHADVIAAVTDKDEINLVICKIAKKGFNINKSIARINNPKNIMMFKTLGVDQTVCSTEVIANLIEYEFDRDICKIVQTFDRGAMILIEVTVKEGGLWEGVYVKNLELPADCVVATVLRNDRAIFARGDTLIERGDHVHLITNRETFHEIKKMLHDRRAPYANQKK